MIGFEQHARTGEHPRGGDAAANQPAQVGAPLLG